MEFEFSVVFLFFLTPCVCDTFFLQGEESDSNFHDELVYHYLDSVMRHLHQYDSSSVTAASAPSSGPYEDEAGDQFSDDGGFADSRPRSTAIQSSSGSATGRSAGHVRGTTYLAGAEPGRLGILRRKLLAFLESSTHYHTEKMLSRFPADELLQERAILLARIGRHEQVLALYAHRLHDPSQALRYCHQVYNEQVEEARHVYLSLLQVLLYPSASLGAGAGVGSGSDAALSALAASTSASSVSPAMLDAALQILAKHHDRISTPKV